MERGDIILRESADSLLQGYGLDIQESKAREWMSQKGIEVADIDSIVETGRTWSREKFEASLQRRIQRHHQGQIDWVVFPWVDRDSRLLLSFGFYIGMLVRQGLKVGFAREDITTVDPPEKIFTLFLHGYKAEADGHMIMEKFNAGKQRRAEEGRFPFYPGNLWPYRYIPSQKKKGGAIREIIPERAAWCCQWYEWLCQGIKGNEIAKRMNKESVPPPRGKEWRHCTIFGILKNKALRGKTEIWGIPMPDATPAIFTEEEGAEIDKILGVNKERASRNAKRVYELSRGFVHCGCGSPMWGRTNKHGKYIYERYECAKCRRHTDKAWLETNVREALLPVLADRKRLEGYLAKGDGACTEKSKSRLALLEAQIDRKLNALTNLKKQHAWGDWADAEYLRERDKVRADLERLQQERSEAKEAYRHCLESESDAKKLEHIAAKVHDKLINASGELVRQLYDVLKLKVTVGEVIQISCLLPLDHFAVEDRPSASSIPPRFGFMEPCGLTRI